ncbi:unnamed protein product [Symbiodinium microadriaticum]|nr:unnamed protein product [Symbiodinium sp. KB8]CAE7908460.1 unnamed protein product [Symbiodinium microadriaticum]
MVPLVSKRLQLRAMAQEAAAAANGQTAVPVPTAAGLIDTKAYGKLKSFAGKEEHWSTWSFVARSYFTLLSPDFASLVQTAENQPSGTMRMHVLSEPAQAWKALVDTYQPDLGGRHTSMLMGIISPSWETVTEGDFLEALENWEVLVRRYQDQATDVVSNATKIAVLMKYSPPSLRGALRTSASIVDWLQSGVFPTAASHGAAHQGATPMDVGAIGHDKKGAGKDKRKKGGKDYGKTGVMAVEEGTATRGWQGGPTNYEMLYDSGSDENVCPYDLVTDEFDEPSKVTLRNVSGGTLSQGVQRRLAFGVVTAEGKEITFRACIKLVVSADKLVPGGEECAGDPGQRERPDQPKPHHASSAVEEQQPEVRGDDQEAWEQAGQDEPVEQEAAEIGARL